jgi:hypothetical protein
MYKYLEDKKEIDECVGKLKKRSEQCVAFNLGLTTNVVFFHNLEPEGGYILMTHDFYNNVHRYSIDITDERSIMKTITNRESHGAREIDDDKLDEILTMLERFKPVA